MMSLTDEELGQRLSGLTQWEGERTALWRWALQIATKSRRSQGMLLQRLLRWRLSPARMGLAAVVFLVLSAAVVNLPQLGTRGEQAGRNASKSRLRAARHLASELAGADSLEGVGHAARLDSPPDLWPVVRSGRTAAPRQFISASTTELPDTAQDTSVSYDFLNVGNLSYAYQRQDGLLGHGGDADTTTSPAGSGRARSAMMRQVVCKATIELKSDDVRAVFLKVQHFVEPALGEFVQDSTMMGTGNQAQAHLTLRVAAGRLSEVLNLLREAAEVVSEQQEGQDVTGQVVDVDARLRNEQKVEAEILELLGSRQEAPLKDILDMREKLALVRTEIERLTAQRERLGELVALATVLVIIRAEGAPVEEATSWASYLAESFGGAWSSGSRFLVDTLATMLQIVVGGMPIGILLAGAGWFVVRRLNRRPA